VNEFGLGSAVVTLRELDECRIAQLNTISLGLGMACFLLSCAAAIPIGHFFSAPRVPAIVMVMSVGFLISSFLTVPDALLQKDLRFKFLAQVEVVKALAQAVVTVIAALLGAGYWALVFGSLIGTSAATVTTLAVCRRGFAVPQLSILRPAVSYSQDILISRLAWYGYSNADFMVAGRVLGAVPLGFYTMAWNIANIPVDKITSLVARVTQAFFSAVQDDNLALRDYLMNLSAGIALFTFPASVGLSLEAGHLITLVLGPKWMGAIIPLRLLSFYVSLRSITTLLPVVLNVRRHSRFVMWNTVAAVVIFPIAFFAGSHWGTTGIAAAWIMCYPLNVVPLYWKAFRTIELSLNSYLQSLWPAFSSSLGLVVAIFGLQVALPGAWSLALRTAIEIVAGSGAYALLFLLFHRDRLRGLYVNLKAVRQSEPVMCY
jgi:PST family polysaccharide transporter